MITRRDALAMMTSAAALLAAGGALAQRQPASGSVSVQDLAQAGPLGDVAQGSADAKVTIIEYASLTCSHCAAFHRDTYPELKKRYIDTGKVRFVLREFPLDPLATAAFMLSRCDGEAKYYPMTDLFFEQQRTWAFSDKPLDAMQNLVKQAGISQEKFQSCLRDQKIYDGVNAVRKRGEEMFKVESTPTFFINGQRHAGNMSIAEIEKIIQPMLGA